jgi:hypothetical protein
MQEGHALQINEQSEGGGIRPLKINFEPDEGRIHFDNGIPDSAASKEN